MVDITLEVYESGSLLENAVIVAFLNCFGNGLHVCVALTDVHVIADTDDICHEGNHVCCLTYCFTMCDLGNLLIKILNLETEEVTCGCK